MAYKYADVPVAEVIDVVRHSSQVSRTSRIDACLITGFLGSGKTTLINRLLRDRAFADSAVIVNEFGDVGIDHQLIASSTDVVLLDSGCLLVDIDTGFGPSASESIEVETRNRMARAFKRIREDGGLSAADREKLCGDVEATLG